MQTQSEQINELAKALSQAQGELRNVAKNATNPHFRNSYADLAAVIDATSETLIKYGLSITQPVNFIELNGVIEQFLETTLMHTSGQWIKSYYHLNPIKRDPQGFGSAKTYARRYCWAAIVGVAQTDDDGHTASQPSATPTKHYAAAPAPISKPAANPDVYSSTNEQKKSLVNAVKTLTAPGQAFEKLAGADKDSAFLQALDKSLQGEQMADVAQCIHNALAEKLGTKK